MLIELRECDPRLLNDLPYLRRTLVQAAEEVGATVVGETFHQFSPQGVTGVVSIAESHLCIHTWPEYGYAAADIFTCGDSFEPRKAAELLVQCVSARDYSITEIQRGLLTEPASTPSQA